MIKISKEEAKQLRSLGIRDGEGGIMTHGKGKGKHSSNYLTESEYCLRKLAKIRGEEVEEPKKKKRYYKKK